MLKETAFMKLIVTATLLAVATGALASDVFKTTDPEGRPVYTDRPATLPAQKLNVQSSSTDVVEVQQRYDAQMKRYAETDKASTETAQQAADRRKAAALSAEDRAKRCTEARQRYESYMNARRLYQPGDQEGDRRYLSDAEIDEARANAKRTMDEFCSGP
jgi:hypothetical protein